ncbi:hypothetical protein PPACK8108_LOCUS1901 [Phakopsora pachyrhizi]|uniref:Uncharacterized protein n=1 Tax=Phakopsora pachyrhizi TaxID=170000 RepID=A0AAV0AH85_PHAPC|nr:hypothetical protein PPACK8108_LOCUS1901 [Phakopsora pachyrhizi]
MTSLVPTSTHAISKGTLGSIILGAVVLIVSPTLNRVLVEDLPSKHPDYPLLTPNFQATLQALDLIIDPVSTLHSAAAEEKEYVGAPQSEVNEQVGITQYINPCLPTFSAIVKHRFTDFLVYEVDNQGQAVHLKDINDPCASEESQDKIVKSKPVSLVSIESKDQRKKFHQTIRELFQGRLVTEHKEIEVNQPAIEITWACPGKNTVRKLMIGFSKIYSCKTKNLNSKPVDSKPPFIHFTLQKTNRETQHALSILYRQLHCNVSKDLGICGTKDKRSDGHRYINELAPLKAQLSQRHSEVSHYDPVLLAHQ